MENILHLRKDHAALCEQMAAILKAANDEKRSMTSEEEERFDNIASDADNIAARIERTEKYNRHQGVLASGYEKKVEPQTEARAAWQRYLIDGVVERGLIKGDDAKGGFLAPKEFVQEMIEGITEWSPIRRLARVIQTSFTSVMMPKRTGQFAAVWTSEAGTRSETTGLTFGMEELPTHEFYALVDVSQQLLEDSVFNVEAYLRKEMMEQFAVAEAAAFMTGTGVGKPWGVVSDTAITDTNSGSNGDFDADDLIDLLYSLKQGYVNNATWMFNYTTLRKIRKLKSNNEYIWSPAATYPNNIVNGLAGTILGQPFLLAPEMANTGTTGNVSVICGDFRSGYLIVDRVQMQIMRDPYTQSTSGNIRFIARKRVGGQVVLAEAINRLKESA